jgi:hypothetical protein
VNDAQFRIKVINVIIGSLGDRSSAYVHAMKLATQLRAIIKQTSSDGTAGAVNKALEELNVGSIDSTYNSFVDSTCVMLGKPREEIEKEAFNDQFSDLENN